MKVYVTIETYQCIVVDVQVFRNEKTAGQLEEAWRKERKITSEDELEHESGEGNEFHVEECELKP